MLEPPRAHIVVTPPGPVVVIPPGPTVVTLLGPVTVTPPGPLLGPDEIEVVGDGPLPDPPPPEIPPPPTVEHVMPVDVELTQLHKALAEVITALRDAAGQAVRTQGTAA